MSDAKTEAMTKLDAILAGQVRLQESFDKVLAALVKPRAAASATGGGAVFPNYGRSKGTPVAGATKQDLEFYRNGALRTLADPGKARWHDREKALLAAICAELGEPVPDLGPPPADDDGPPPADDVAF